MLVFGISKAVVCLHYETQLTHTKGCTSSKNTLHTPPNYALPPPRLSLHTASSKQKNNI